jgi:hypothetical protein
MLQAGRVWVKFPIRPLDFSIDLILPATLWPEGLFTVNFMGKGGGGDKAQPVHKTDDLTTIHEPTV